MANRVAIVTDTTACVPREQVEKYGIELVPIGLVFGDKVYRDGIDISPAEFYALLRQVKKLPTTSGSLPGPFLEAYREASQRASSILCITESSKFSGMCNSARVAREMSRGTLPNIDIEVLECTTAAAGQGLVVLAAAKAAVSGKSLIEVIDTAKSVMPRVNLFAYLDTLHYLVKGGRVPKAAALAGSLLQIKPIFTVSDGDAYPVTNARTNPGAIKCIIKIMEQKVAKGPLHVAVMHADALDKAEALRNLISSQFDCAELFITEFTPVMGAHTGPGVIGAAFYSGD
ncbi:MAG TPA: DegV family protein [Dehalococcoidia bacterium]|jgi:DegV family protein with EDD domain|nr:DegV family protein [Dehalococcoidia bacterium]